MSAVATRPLVVIVQCQAKSDSLEVVHDALAQFWVKLERMRGRRAEETQMRVDLAVSEIAANIVEHAHSQSMTLRLSETAGQVVAEFTDTGQGWTGPPEAAHLIDVMAERGRGLALCKAAVDDITYEREGSLNRWRLTKRL
jgi:serine/threonine-protein kinase RsbW